MLALKSSGSYPGKYITFEELEPGDFVGMQFKPERPNGHIGIAVEKTQYGMVFLMFHASSSMGLITVMMDKTENSYLLRHVTVYKTRT